MRAFAPLVLLLLAGCVALPGADRGALTTAVCDPARCDVLATVDPPTRQANELSVAVNPLDPRNIIATGKDYTPDEAGDCTWAGIYTTKDGGATWKNQNVPGSPWKRLRDPSTPATPFSKFWCVTDPVVAFGPDGRAYWTVMPYQCDPATGSKTGRGVLPQGGLNDWAWSCSAMYVLVSDDGGETWPVEKARMVAEGARLVHDKQWLAVSPDARTVLLCWDFQGPASTTPSEPVVEPEYGVVCSVSRDRGESWSRFEVASRRGAYPWVEFDADGRAWMILTEGFEEGRFLALSSDDGLSWSEPVEFASFVNGPERNEYGWPTLRGSGFRIVPTASLAIDRSDGEHRGRLYVAYFDHAAGHGDAMLTWSDDGKMWSPPARVNDDAADADQFMPAVSVGPDGTVDVSWQDRRDDAHNRLFHTYYAYSTDGGVTFSRNLRVSAVASDEAHSHHQNGMVFLGDYRDSDSVRGAATFVWVDTRAGKADVRVATVERPAADGR
ncbi:MAG TPA: sialidase family protein [Candidatus Thermoplasmatota archaeon]|nr:sialidase family protein [Candidatus Thermoplasmatota archaeon]